MWLIFVGEEVYRSPHEVVLSGRGGCASALLPQKICSRVTGAEDIEGDLKAMRAEGV